MTEPASDRTDPAEVLVEWEDAEAVIAVVPEGPTKEALRLLASGCNDAEIAHRLGVSRDDAVALVARGRMRVLTAALAATHPV